MEAQQLLKILPSFNDQKILIKKNQSVNDIIKALNVAHNQYKSHYDKIAQEFLGHSKKQTAYNIWKFLKKNIPYKAEPDTMQTIKSPAAIIQTGLMGKKSLYYNDCKNYSLFAGGILSALNRQGYDMPYVYRFSSYNLFNQEPGHVFIVVNPGKKEIWIDAVLNKFDYKKSYINAIDKNFDKMMYSISGFDNVLTGNRKAKRQEKRAERKTKREQRRKEGKGFGQRIVKTLKKSGKAVLKVAAAPVRNSFLLLVKLNFRSLATNLKKADTKAPAKLREFWEGAGGRYQNLLTAINQGSKKRRLGAIGEPVTAAAAATTAAPLLVKIASLLKKIGISPEDLGQIATDVIRNKVQNAIEKAETQIETQEQSSENTAEQLESSSLPQMAARQNVVKLTNETGLQVVEKEQTGINKNILIIGGVAVAALLLMKKK